MITIDAVVVHVGDIEVFVFFCQVEERKIILERNTYKPTGGELASLFEIEFRKLASLVVDDGAYFFASNGEEVVMTLCEISHFEEWKTAERFRQLRLNESRREVTGCGVTFSTAPINVCSYTCSNQITNKQQQQEDKHTITTNKQPLAKQCKIQRVFTTTTSTLTEVVVITIRRVPHHIRPRFKTIIIRCTVVD